MKEFTLCLLLCDFESGLYSKITENSKVMAETLFPKFSYREVEKNSNILQCTLQIPSVKKLLFFVSLRLSHLLFLVSLSMLLIKSKPL